MEKLHTIGVAGCGHLFVNSILPLAQKSERLKINAVYDPALGPNNHLGLPVAASYGELLSNDEIDTIWIVSPAPFHAGQAISAMRAGKNVYVQKPLCTSYSELEDLLEVERETRVSVVAAPGMMVYPTWRLVHEEMASGAMGTPYCAQAGFMGWGGDEITWPNDPSWFFQEGGGPMRDHGVYTLSALIGLLGKPVLVTALGNIREKTRVWKGHGTFQVTEQDNLAVVIEFESGVLATLNEAWCAGSERYVFEFHGTNGCLRTFGSTWDACPRGYEFIDSGGNLIKRIDADCDESIHKYFAPENPNAHVWADICYLAYSIDAGQASECSIAHSAAVYVTIDAIFRSIKNGQVEYVEMV